MPGWRRWLHTGCLGFFMAFLSRGAALYRSWAFPKTHSLLWRGNFVWGESRRSKRSEAKRRARRFFVGRNRRTESEANRKEILSGSRFPACALRSSHLRSSKSDAFPKHLSLLLFFKGESVEGFPKPFFLLLETSHRNRKRSSILKSPRWWTEAELRPSCQRKG